MKGRLKEIPINKTNNKTNNRTNSKTNNRTNNNKIINNKIINNSKTINRTNNIISIDSRIKIDKIISKRKSLTRSNTHKVMQNNRKALHNKTNFRQFNVINAKNTAITLIPVIK